MGFERFTERARQSIILAQDEARAFRHDKTGVDFILLGLLREEEGLAAKVLDRLDVTIEGVRTTITPLDDEPITGQIPFTPGAKKSFEHALREALSLGHNYIGTEHLLLGLVRGESPPLYLVDFLGESYQKKVRDEVVRMLSGPTSEAQIKRMKEMTKTQLAAKLPTPSTTVFLDNAEIRMHGVVHFEKLDGDYLFECESDGVKTLIPAHRVVKVEFRR